MCLSGQVGCVPLAFSGCELLRIPAQVALHRHLQRPCTKRAKRTTIYSRPRGACPSIGDAACWLSGLVASWSVAGNVSWCIPANRRRCDVGRDLMGRRLARLRAHGGAGRPHAPYSYGAWLNRRHRRAGAPFQGRFKAMLVENESYCWTLSVVGSRGSLD